jgi:hypothetical protein
MFEAFRRHPWALETTVGVRVMGPNELSWLEEAVAALSDTGLDGAEMMDCAALLVGHVRGVAQQAAAAPSGDDPEQAMDAAIVELLAGREDRFPAVLAAIRSAAERGKQGQALQFGLDRILDGIAQLVATRA